MRELLSNELDDDLLNDDNTSFTSHDFQSSSRSQETPNSEFPPDSPHQQWSGQLESSNGCGTAFHQYPARIPGGFDRPPLLTARGFQLLKGNVTENEHQHEQGPGDYDYHNDESIQFHQNSNEYLHQKNDKEDHQTSTNGLHHYRGYEAGNHNIAFGNYEETRSQSAFQWGRLEGQHHTTDYRKGQNDKNIYNYSARSDSSEEEHADYGQQAIDSGRYSNHAMVRTKVFCFNIILQY